MDRCPQSRVRQLVSRADRISSAPSKMRHQKRPVVRSDDRPGKPRTIARFGDIHRSDLAVGRRRNRSISGQTAIPGSRPWSLPRDCSDEDPPGQQSFLGYRPRRTRPFVAIGRGSGRANLLSLSVLVLPFEPNHRVWHEPLAAARCELRSIRTDRSTRAGTPSGHFVEKTNV